jgi:GDP-4-dehydro-6-deoxy-D-mannose reductase
MARPPRSILLTGASGFVGRHLIARLWHAYPNAMLHTGAFDVTDRGATGDAVRKARPDACVHLAAVSAVPEARRDPGHAWNVNLHGTLNLGHALRQTAPECLFAFISTAEAYGHSFRAGLAVDETMPLAPMNTYAATKAAADLALGAMAAEGLQVIRLRPFNHTGPGQTDAFAVPAFARQMALIAAGLQEPVLRVGSLESRRDFLDVRDVCEGYVACIAQRDELPAGTILNIASGTPRRLSDVLDQMLALSGVTARIETDASRLRPVEITTACGDASAARRLLGWAPRIPWEQTLSDVLADWRERIAQM